ncbi:MAG TPA: translation elongation factor Ts [Longimicrobiales bacterium]|jgi:elongation factor Ts|nr:translation elongation factor Ts [Longimicrobiales bacterium]
MAMEISAARVKELRDMTGAGMMECKKALQEAGGDIEKAVDLLRVRGAAKAAKRAGREAREGAVGSYIHMGGRIGVLIEVNCETDFVARNELFQELVKDLAMHIAAMDPIAVTAEEIPAEVVERERAVALEKVKGDGKPENLHEKIVEGMMKKFYQERTLMDQEFVRDTDRKVRDLVAEAAATTGENIVVRRFARFAIGE